MKSKDIKHFRDLEVYKRAFAGAMRIFEITKAFPVEERYSLIDQIRRSSRSVCSNLAESWRNRRYKAVFKHKLTNAMQEASETLRWLESLLLVNIYRKVILVNSTRNMKKSFQCSTRWKRMLISFASNSTSQLPSFSASPDNSINNSVVTQECSRCKSI